MGTISLEPSEVIMPISVHRGKSVADLERKTIEYFLELDWFVEQHPVIVEAMEDELARRDRSYDPF